MQTPLRLIRIIVPAMLLLALSIATAPASAQATIVIQFSEAASTVSEGDGMAVGVSAEITGGSTSDSFSVDLAVTDISTTSGMDYVTPLATYTLDCSTVPVIMTCLAGSYEELALELIDDMDVEGEEQVQFTISNPQGPGLSLGANTTHTLTITDNDAAGDPPIRLYPLDGATLDGPNNYDWPRFTFAPFEGAEWYQVWVGPDDYSRTDYTSWMSAGSGCTVDTCTVPADIWLINDDYEWWMTYWGSTLPDIDTYWNSTTFTVNFAAPTTSYNHTSPSASAANVTELVWPRDTAVLWYQIWLGTANYQTEVFFGWQDARDICDDTTCTLPLDAALALDDYEWWMEAWGPNGYITWTDTMANPYSFSVIDAG